MVLSAVETMDQTSQSKSACESSQRVLEFFQTCIPLSILIRVLIKTTFWRRYLLFEGEFLKQTLFGELCCGDMYMC